MKWNKDTLYLIPPVGLSKVDLFYWRISNDKKWYIEKFLKIRTKNAELVPFIFNKAQELVYEKYLECLRDNKLPRFIVLKSRQQGISTLTEALMFADTATSRNKSTFIIAHEQAASSALFNMSKLYYDELPAEIQPTTSKSNEKALVFENKENPNAGLRSKFTIGTANTAEGGRGNTFHNVHVSEVAFFPQAERTLTAIVQAVPDFQNTMIVLESTANGVGGYFHDQWLLAKQKKSEFVPVFLPWSFDPTCVKSFKSKEEFIDFAEQVNRTFTDHNGDKIHTADYYLKEEYNLTYEQLNWRTWAINNKCGGSVDMFHQEYPINDMEAFISSGRPVFHIERLKQYQLACTEPKVGFLDGGKGIISFRESDKGYLSVWEEPKPGKIYVVGADVSEGLEHGDFSTAYVLDASNFDIVACWHGHTDPDLFGVELVKVAQYYRNAYLAVENNNHGLTTLKSIQRLEYWNIFFTKTIDKISDKLTQKMGWSTNKATKPVMIDKLAEFIREKYIGIKDKKLIHELVTYVRDANGSTNAQAGCYDDRVMAIAIALSVGLEGREDNYEPEDSVFNLEISGDEVAL